MAVNYGSGDKGSVTLSQNTELLNIESYENLTIPAGLTLTVPNGSVLQVTDTLTVDGTISVEPRYGSGAAGYGADAGGSMLILAKNVTGSGVIRANGKEGIEGGNNNNNNNNDSGSDALPPVLAGAKTNVITQGSQGAYASTGGVSGDTAIGRDLLSIWIDEWIIPSAKISGLPMAKMLSGGGADASRGRQNYNGNAYGGGGGAGGSFGGRGGNGGNGGRNGNANGDGRSGSGGGGAGGLITLISESISTQLTIELKGGMGGAGTFNSTTIGGAGGGGSGGILITVTPDNLTPTYDLSGGPTGAGQNPGNDGQDGVFTHIPISMIE